MPINVNCLRALTKIGLPMRVEVRDRNGSYVTDAVIDIDGKITDLNSNVQYDQPSALRAALIEPNGPTYTRLFLKGKDLRSLGVKP